MKDYERGYGALLIRKRNGRKIVFLWRDVTPLFRSDVLHGVDTKHQTSQENQEKEGGEREGEVDLLTIREPPYRKQFMVSSRHAY